MHVELYYCVCLITLSVGVPFFPAKRLNFLSRTFLRKLEEAGVTEFQWFQCGRQCGAHAVTVRQVGSNSKVHSWFAHVYSIVLSVADGKAEGQVAKGGVQTN